jgi:glucose-1-phosphate adenylyltransferase
MNYLDMLRTHVLNRADVTIAALPVERKAAKSLGVMRCDGHGRVTGFLEKPQTDQELDMVRMDTAWMTAQGLDCQGRECLASMGLYIFNRDLLVEILNKTNYQDFGKEVFPAAIRSRKVQVHLFDDYWEDIGTIRAFYEANLQLTKPDSPFDFLRQDQPIYSRARFLPPTMLDGATVSSSLIADGCRIGKGCVIENSIIGLRCVIGQNVTIKDSIIMGSDLTDSPADLAQHAAAGRPPLGIGSGSKIIGAILDKNTQVGQNVIIENVKQVENSDAQPPCLIRDGIPILCKEGILRDGFRLVG